jgi:hypothetical protein
MVRSNALTGGRRKDRGVEVIMVTVQIGHDIHTGALPIAAVSPERQSYTTIAALSPAVSRCTTSCFPSGRSLTAALEDDDAVVGR